MSSARSATKSRWGWAAGWFAYTAARPRSASSVTEIEQEIEEEQFMSNVSGTKILRFARSERILHWCIAGPFLVSMTTALIMVAVYNLNPSRPYRGFFSGMHRASGVALMILPMFAAFKARGDARLHLYNIRQAWIWMFDDFKWLGLMGLAAI